MAKRFKKIFLQSLKKLILTIGFLGSIFIVLAFTDIPYRAYHALSLSDQKIEHDIDVIVIMGGDGMPSPKGLMRVYHGALLGLKHPQATIIIALPYNQKDSTHQLDLMGEALIRKGIFPEKIRYAANGYNTRTQALEISKMVPQKESIVIVSSAEHMYRAIRTFENVGFQNVGSSATFEIPPDEESLKDKKKASKKIQNLNLRYNVWSYMQYEILVMREYVAIVYYWMNGWI